MFQKLDSKSLFDALNPMFCQYGSNLSHFTPNTLKNNETTYPPTIAKVFVLTSFCALATLAADPAQAIVLDFESLAVSNDTFKDVGTTYTEDGFTVSQVGSQSFPLVVWGTQASSYPGSTALYNNTNGGITRLNQVGGGAFTLSSIDLARLDNPNNTTVTTSIPVNFTGTRADATTISQAFTITAPGLTTFNFTNFTNLVSVDWTQVPQFHQFDNICINDSCQTATAVPEPFTVLGTIFGAGYGVALKRKLAKAQADKQGIG